MYYQSAIMVAHRGSSANPPLPPLDHGEEWPFQAHSPVSGRPVQEHELVVQRNRQHAFVRGSLARRVLLTVAFDLNRLS